MNKPFLTGLLRSEDGVNTILRNGGRYLSADTAWYAKRLEFSAQPLCGPETPQAFLRCANLRLGEVFIKFLISHPNLAKMITRKLGGSYLWETSMVQFCFDQCIVKNHENEIRNYFSRHSFCIEVIKLFALKYKWITLLPLNGKKLLLQLRVVVPCILVWITN